MVSIDVRIAVLAGVALLTGCSTHSSSGQSSPAASAQTQAGCHADKASFAIGKAYTEEIAQRAKQASGAKLTRALRPGQAATMDYREDRLNFELNESGSIESVRCG